MDNKYILLHILFIQPAIASMSASPDDPLKIKLDWLFIADNYRNIGEKGRAYEVVKDLVSFSGDTDDYRKLKERYEHHLAEWERFSAANSADGDAAMLG